MNNYSIELKDGSLVPIEADFVEMQDGFFLFYKDDMNKQCAEVIKYQSSETVSHVTLQKEFTEEETLEQARVKEWKRQQEDN